MPTSRPAARFVASSVRVDLRRGPRDSAVGRACIQSAPNLRRVHAESTQRPSADPVVGE